MTYPLTSTHKAALNAWIATINGDSPQSTYQGSYDVPFQRWFKFKEAFSPLLVKRLIDQSDIPVLRLIDVFGGCGTGALTSSFLGIESTIVEVNPFLVDVIRAKLEHYDVRKIYDAHALWRRQTQVLYAGGVAVPDYLPESFVEKKGLDRWIYPRDVMKRLIAYREALRFVRDASVRRLFRVLLGSIVVEVSNAVVNGKGRKYRENWEARQKRPRDVDEALALRLQSVVYDITRFQHRPRVRSTVIHGDSRAVIGEITQGSIVVSSPAYPNSFDYTDIYNLELWVLGYIQTRSQETRLRRAAIRSHVQRRLVHEPCQLASPTLQRTLRRLRSVHDELWDHQIPNMVDSYFYDLGTILSGLMSRVTAGGEVAFIVADSAYAGVVVPVGTILAEMGEALGYRLYEVEKLRTIKSSAQQGWKPALREEVVRLKKMRRSSVR